jgi:hypothetical protein
MPRLPWQDDARMDVLKQTTATNQAGSTWILSAPSHQKLPPLCRGMLLRARFFATTTQWVTLTALREL